MRGRIERHSRWQEDRRTLYPRFNAAKRKKNLLVLLRFACLQDEEADTVPDITIYQHTRQHYNELRIMRYQTTRKTARPHKTKQAEMEPKTQAPIPSTSQIDVDPTPTRPMSSAYVLKTRRPTPKPPTRPLQNYKQRTKQSHRDPDPRSFSKREINTSDAWLSLPIAAPPLPTHVDVMVEKTLLILRCVAVLFVIVRALRSNTFSTHIALPIFLAARPSESPRCFILAHRIHLVGDLVAAGEHDVGG